VLFSGSARPKGVPGAGWPERAEYWRYGFWFKDGASDSQALVQVEDTATPEAPGAAIGGQVLDVHHQPVPAGPFVAFFADRDDASAEPGAQGDPPMAAFRPVTPTASEKPPEVFVSYA
jgi:hypothetical protein